MECYIILQSWSVSFHWSLNLGNSTYNMIFIPLFSFFIYLLPSLFSSCHPLSFLFLSFCLFYYISLLLSFIFLSLFLVFLISFLSLFVIPFLSFCLFYYLSLLLLFFSFSLFLVFSCLLLPFLFLPFGLL